MRKLMPWEDAEDIVLSNGVVVKAISVPPYLTNKVYESVPPPKAPKAHLKSELTGGEEVVRALPDTPEWEEYWEERNEWQNQLVVAMEAFQMDYGVIGWKYPETDEWIDAPPEDWEPPAMLEYWGIGIDMDSLQARKIAFLRLIVIRNMDDLQLLTKKWTNESPPTTGEVEAASVPFV